MTLKGGINPVVSVRGDENVPADVHTGAGSLLERDHGQTVQEMVQDLFGLLTGLLRDAVADGDGWIAAQDSDSAIPDLGETAQAAETAQALFDIFISQLDHALREIGVGDLSVAKKMRKLGEAFYGRAKAYDAALADPSDAELAALIGRTAFESEGDAARVAALTAYVRKVVAALAAEPLETVLDGRADWPDLAP